MDEYLKKILDRRRFLQLMGTGFAGASTMMLVPGIAWGKTAFDLAIEGQNLIAKKDFAKAVKALSEAVRLDPESDWACGLLGRAYYGLKNYTESVVWFRQAVLLNPNDSYSRMMLEIITQRPVPKKVKPQKKPTRLEIEAKKEEEQMLSTIESEKGLGYQVKRVVIDPGHGGFDPGAVGKSGLREKDVVLEIGKRIHDRLEKQGKIASFLTRNGDYYVPLGERTVIANQHRADLFISLHINANEKISPAGSETYYCSGKASSAEAARVAQLENAVLKYDEQLSKQPGSIDIEEILFKFEQKMNWRESGKFAKSFQDRFATALPFKSRGVNSANFYVLRRAKMPAILLETGFISNADNEAQLKQSKVLDTITDAVIRGLG